MLVVAVFIQNLVNLQIGWSVRSWPHDSKMSLGVKIVSACLGHNSAMKQCYKKALSQFSRLNLAAKTLKIHVHVVEFANSVDPDEAAHIELPHPDLYCLSSKSLHSQYDNA